MNYILEVGLATILFGVIILAAFLLGKLANLFHGYIRPGAPPRKWYALVALIFFGVISGLIMQGSFLNLLVVICGVGFFLPFFFIVVASAALAQKIRKHPISGLVKSAALVWCVCALAIALSAGIGGGLNTWEIRSARGYVERVMPILDDIKAREGVYPTTLPVAVAGQPPTLLRSSGSYTSDGKSFRFQYWDPAGMMDGYELESSKRVWSYFD